MKQTSLKFLTFLACGASVALIQTSNAEEGASGKSCPSGKCEKETPLRWERPNAGKRSEWLTKELSLTAEQQAQIKPVLDAEQAQIKAALDDASLSDDQKKAKATEARQAANGHIKGLLTPEQQAKLDELKKDRPRGPRKEHEKPQS
jgi:Spy/CpxP family protein refolding chaperone